MSLLLLTVIGHMGGYSELGNGSFLLLLLSFMFIMRSRFVARQDVPPPGFILVIMGWSSAGIASTILLLIPYISVSIFWYQLSKLLLFQGFLLFPIMGIGGFLFPRFFGLPNLQNFDESRALPPGWKTKAAFAGLCGLIVMFGFVLEARGMVRAGPIFRLIGVAIYFGREVPFFSTFKNHGTLGVYLGTALLTLMTGMICQAAFPQYAVAMEHIILVGGFGLLTLTVATRVILGHGGQTHRFKAKIRPLVIMMILVIAALATRMIADILPQIRVSHQVYAAILWIAAILTWAIKILPGVLQTGDDPQ